MGLPKKSLTNRFSKLKRLKWFDISSLFISLAALLISVWVGVIANDIAQNQNNLNNLYLPFSYDVIRGEEKYSYASKDGVSLFPAYESEIDVVSGSPKDISVIFYNGDPNQIDIKSVENLDVFESPTYVYKFTTQVPNQDFIVSEDYYDYFFLYTVSSSDIIALDCYYYKINFENGFHVEGPHKVPRANLLLAISNTDQETAISSSYKDMLMRYYELVQMINQIMVSK